MQGLEELTGYSVGRGRTCCVLDWQANPFHSRTHLSVQNYQNHELLRYSILLTRCPVDHVNLKTRGQLSHALVSSVWSLLDGLPYMVGT